MMTSLFSGNGHKTKLFFRESRNGMKDGIDTISTTCFLSCNLFWLAHSLQLQKIWLFEVTAGHASYTYPLHTALACTN